MEIEEPGSDLVVMGASAPSTAELAGGRPQLGDGRPMTATEPRPQAATGRSPKPATEPAP
jgi:hypothetical protein